MLSAPVAGLLAAFGSIAAPVPKDNAVPVAPPPRPLIRFHALYSNNTSEVASQRTVSYGEFVPTGPVEGTFVLVAKNVSQVALDPGSKVLYGIAPRKVLVVPTGVTDRTKLAELRPPANVTGLRAPSGIAFDSKRGRLVVAGLGGKGHLYAYTPRNGKWEELTDLNGLRLAALTYSPRADVLYGLYESLNGEVPTVGAFDPATGKLKDEIPLTDPGLPEDFGKARRDQTTVQMAAVGNHIVMLTKRQMFRLDLTTNKVAIEWKK